MTPGETAAIAVVASAIVTALPSLARFLLGSRLSTRKVSLDEIRQRTDALDSSYDRLEKENARLGKRVDDLETTLTEERERCRRLEDQLRALGVRIRNLPPNGEK